MPNAACATEVEFLLGDLRLAVPRALGLRAACTGAEQAWTGAYSAWPGAKPDVRALCRVTENGRRPVDVAHAWMAFSNVRKELEGACRGSSGSDPSTEACTAISQTEPTVVQFYARQDGIPAPSLGHFRTETITEARAAGEAEGVRCKASTNGPRTRYCTAWLELTPEVLAISTVKLGPERDGEDPPSDTAILVRVLTRGLAFR